MRTNTRGRLEDSSHLADKGLSLDTVNDFKFADDNQENRDPNPELKVGSASQYATNATLRKEESPQKKLLQLRPQPRHTQSRQAVDRSPSPMKPSLRSDLSLSSSLFVPQPSPGFSIEGVSVEQINNERNVNRELLKIAKSYLEAAKLVKAAVQGVTKRVPGANLLAAQVQSKLPRHLEEVRQCKLKLEENYSVCF